MNVGGVEMNKDLRFDSLIKEKSVLCWNCSLNRCGLISYNGTILNVWSHDKETDGEGSGPIVYFYHEEPIDTEHYLVPCSTNPLLLIPTKERAIVEYIINEKWCDEGLLIEALKSYMFDFNTTDFTLLYEVADFFGLSREILDYWIHEAETDIDYCSV